MPPAWLIDANYRASSAAALGGNVLVILLSMNVTAQEIRAYRWIISIQAAFQAIASLLNLIMNYVSFWCL